MLVTKIEPVTRSKSRIYVDERRWCTLYNKELYRYSLREGQPVSDGVYGEIMGEVLTKRAKRRVLYLLRSMDRTEQQLRQKLKITRKRSSISPLPMCRSCIIRMTAGMRPITWITGRRIRAGSS